MLIQITSPLQASDGVILLHGLCRTSRSMLVLQRRLEEAGFVVVNVGYPSRSAPVGELAGRVIAPALEDPRIASCAKVHFVTHSLGGILVRGYLGTHRIGNLGRVVMLGPPNQGSEVMDRLGALGISRRILGPAGAQLGTGRGSPPADLGPVDFELGVIAGDRSFNWINSLMIPGRDDGKVSVERTKVAGMTDHLVVHAAHPFLMRNRIAIRQTVQFLRNGRFSRPQAQGGGLQ